MQRADSFLATGYRHFLAAAETGSVRAASRQINVAASAISRQIALLEAQLGITLFDRSGRNLELSPAGEALLRGLRATSRSHEETLDYLSALRGLKRGRVRVATVESISVSVLPDLLESFTKSYPGLQVSVTVAGSDAVTELVRDHTADIGFTFNPMALDGLEVELWRDMPLGAIMSPSHPLARSKKLSLAECFAHPVAWPSRGLSLRTILDRKSPRSSGKLNPAFECNSLRLMASLARRGSCIAFQTRIGIEQELNSGELIFVPLADRGLPIDRLMVVRRAGQVGRLAADTFLALAKTFLPNGGDVRK
jgi:DNA-binding transcriptional LysR family regulator